jgi:hypothetical protein
MLPTEIDGHVLRWFRFRSSTREGETWIGTAWAEQVGRYVRDGWIVPGKTR